MIAGDGRPTVYVVPAFVRDLDQIFVRDRYLSGAYPLYSPADGRYEEVQAQQAHSRFHVFRQRRVAAKESFRS